MSARHRLPGSDPAAAGASTRRRRDAEATRAAERQRERDLVAVAVVAALPLATYVLARSGMARLEAVGIATFALVLLAAWLRSASAGDAERVGRWASGAWGEEATAAALDGLNPRRFAVFHDVVLPGGRENLDHVVVWRGGVVVVETKRWRGRVVIGRSVRVDGARRNDVLEQVQRLRGSLARALHPLVGDAAGTIDAYVCVHARHVRRAWFRRRPEISGVPFGSPDDLLRWLRRRRRTLRREEVREIAKAVDSLRSVPTGRQ